MWQRINHLYLPRTGVVTSQRAGDDGYFQAGVPGGTRLAQLVDAGNGTVRDRATGLTWVKQPELIIPGAVGVHATNQVQVARGNWGTGQTYAKADLAKDTTDSTYWVCVYAHVSAPSGTFAADRAANPTYWRQSVWTASAANLTTPALMTWANAVDNSLALEYAGFSDWRLPNVLELATIYDLSRAAAPYAYSAFTNAQNGYYWTSTPRGTNPTASAYNILFDSRMLIDTRTMTDAIPFPRPVRGGRVIAV